jgi:hypothetical protein
MQEWPYIIYEQKNHIDRILINEMHSPSSESSIRRKNFEK